MSVVGSTPMIKVPHAAPISIILAPLECQRPSEALWHTPLPISKYATGRDDYWLRTRIPSSRPRSRSRSSPPGTREPGGGGGVSGGNLPPQLWSCGGAAPQLWTVIVVHFCFRLFLHENLGLSKKIVGQIRGVFSFGQGLPWTPGDVCPPPQLQSSSRAPEAHRQVIEVIHVQR